MEYRIFTVRDRAGLDAMPVAKILDYPMEKRDYRPFAQSILCRDGQGFVLRMWAFEVSPSDGSELRAVLYPFGGSGLSLHARLWMEGGEIPRHELFLCRGGEKERAVDYAFTNHSGEDLQGIYWGGEFALSDAALNAAGGAAGNKKIPGNFYKICPDKHYGSFSPANWEAPWNIESMGTLEITDHL